METSLPVGIESSLREAGFSATEILLVRRLLGAQALTLRELATNTGKSTGVLDQAMKKLLGKKIADRTTVNGQPKYTIPSLDSIVRWVRRDTEERREMLERRHQNFRQFIDSLKITRGQPAMEYFHGSEGIEQAYRRLLDTGKELLTLQPAFLVSDDDPLREFHATFFRCRQARKIFQRVLAPDTCAARRFRSRDPFEYRRTLLLPETECPVTFEKTISGDIVACIDHRNLSACFIRFPDFAEAERRTFEVLWKRQCDREKAPPAEAADRFGSLASRLSGVPSSLRELAFGLRNIIVFTFVALMSVAITAELYVTAWSVDVSGL